MIKVIVIDDHPLILKMVTEDVNGVGDMRIVGTANHGSKLHALVREKSPDVVILDLGMSTGVFEPVAAVRQLLQDHPKVKVLILTGDDSPVYIRDLTDAGVMGYVLKSDDISLELPQAIRAIYNNERFYSPAVANIFLAESKQPVPTLSDRELQVLRLVAEGHQNDRIGEILGISGKWVRNTLSDVYGKLSIGSEVNQRVVVVNKARELGLLP